MISDASRFNRVIGMPPRREFEINGERHMEDRLIGFKQRWIEHPWLWIENQVLAVERSYQVGACKYSYACFSLEEGQHQTELHVYFGFQTKNLFRKLIFWYGLQKLHRRILKLVQNFEKSSGDLKKTFENPHHGPPEILDRVRVMGKKLIQEGCRSECVDRLTDYVCFGDDLKLSRIRIKELSTEWQCDWQDLLKTALFASKHDLLTMTWDTICPHCRGVRKESFSLSDVQAKGNCDVCKIDFEVFDEDTLEITFHVHPSVREIERLQYCSAEPARKRHIRTQMDLEPNSKTVLQLTLPMGAYRFRSLTGTFEAMFETQKLLKSSQVKVDLDSPATHYTTSPNLGLEVINNSGDHKKIVFEDLLPEQFCVRPRDIFSHPEFRQLFSKEYLATGMRLNLGTQVILFTDVVGSTKFYDEMGDKEHFTELEKLVREGRGVWVKTIGDSVMASFATTELAMSAAIAIQKRFPHGRVDTPIRLRVVIHKGPVIAVNLNSGIDYFGATVNLAAKLQAVVGGGEIGVTDICSEDLTSLDRNLIERRETCRVGNNEVSVSVLSFHVGEKQKIA